MAASNRDSRNTFFSAVSAMVPMTPEDAHRIVVNPLNIAKTQTETAAHVRVDFGPNKTAVELLNNCYNQVVSVVNNKNTIEQKNAVDQENTAAADDVVSTPSFRS
ncbi:MAG: hypothetical protein LEGION0403_FIIPPAGN_01929 [Legionella sp.]|uniref:hypothetical protein n=1 Tax=Legionella sp. TaxID=459 RepID=UPI003D0B475C